jgi:hypothetical protein
MKRSLRAALVGAVVAMASAANADVNDYVFKLAQPDVKVGPQSEFAVMLVNKVTSKPVPDAVIFATRLDMTPDGMAMMATSVTPIAATTPGEYRFKANFSMEGRWQLSLGAKLQGESGTLENKLIIKVLQ